MQVVGVLMHNDPKIRRHDIPPFLLQARINISRSSTFRGIACDVEKITFLSAFGANIWRYSSCNEKSALITSPVGQAALGAYIPFKSAVCCVAAACTYPFLLFGFHFISFLIRAIIEQITSRTGLFSVGIFILPVSYGLEKKLVTDFRGAWNFLHPFSGCRPKTPYHCISSPDRTCYRSTSPACPTIGARCSCPFPGPRSHH